MNESLVVPDLHLKPWIFTRADEIMQQEGISRAIFLGDHQDDWDEQNNIELYYETNSKLLEFAEKYPQSLFCYGNHDISYWYRREESGYSFRAESMVQSFLMEMRKTLKGRLAFCHRVDQVVFSHAGITKGFVEEFVECKSGKVDDIIEEINAMGANALWTFASPIWARPSINYVSFDNRYLQVCGHTPVGRPTMAAPDMLIVDLFSTYRDKTPIGTNEFTIVDTETKTWRMIK